jgi:hypothetical protein
LQGLAAAFDSKEDARKRLIRDILGSSGNKLNSKRGSRLRSPYFYFRELRRETCQVFARFTLHRKTEGDGISVFQIAALPESASHSQLTRSAQNTMDGD